MSLEYFSTVRLLTSAIGIVLNDQQIEEVKEKLQEKNIRKIDVQAMIQVLHIHKEMQMDEPGDQEDEYLDAFVALGGQTDKSGVVEIDMLREIIKDDFELTISMEDYLNSVDSDQGLNFYQFCVPLDASTSGNPSRFSSLLSNRGFSVLQGSLFQ